RKSPAKPLTNFGVFCVILEPGGILRRAAAVGISCESECRRGPAYGQGIPADRATASLDRPVAGGGPDSTQPVARARLRAAAPPHPQNAQRLCPREALGAHR